MLNKKGFGLQAMMASVLVLMIALVIIAVLVDKLFAGMNYTSIEEKLVEAREKLSITDKFVSTETLISKNVLDESIMSKYSCTGYVALINDEYKAYIDCKNYKTVGYLDSVKKSL